MVSKPTHSTYIYLFIFYLLFFNYPLLYHSSHWFWYYYILLSVHLQYLYSHVYVSRRKYVHTYNNMKKRIRISFLCTLCLTMLTNNQFITVYIIYTYKFVILFLALVLSIFLLLLRSRIIIIIKRKW